MHFHEIFIDRFVSSLKVKSVIIAFPSASCRNLKQVLILLFFFIKNPNTICCTYMQFSFGLLVLGLIFPFDTNNCNKKISSHGIFTQNLTANVTATISLTATAAAWEKHYGISCFGQSRNRKIDIYKL
jgi:hypothetical protein